MGTGSYGPEINVKLRSGRDVSKLLHTEKKSPSKCLFGSVFETVRLDVNSNLSIILQLKRVKMTRVLYGRRGMTLDVHPKVNNT